MTPGWSPEIVTLGERLRAAAAALARQHTPRFAWSVPAASLLERIAALPQAESGRFQRREIDERQLPGLEAPPQPAPDDAGAPLPPVVAGRLRERIGAAADILRVHDDPRAHRLAQRHDADAVTLGADVHFAAGRFRPHDLDGLALIAHEGVHVAHALAPPVHRRVLPTGVAEEEARAHDVERAVRGRGRVADDALPRMPRPAAATPPSAPPADALVPMRAESSRNEPRAAAQAAPIDLEALRRTLMRDLMSQVRADLERGG